MTAASDEYISRPSHCCKNHGCKYALSGCPVVAGTVVQEFPCESCTWALERVDRRYSEGEIGTHITVAYRRGDQTLTDAPSDDEAMAAMAKLLEGVEILPGWTVTYVGN